MEADRDRGVFEQDAVDDLGSMTDTRVYEGDLEARPPGSDQPDRSEVESLEFLESVELRAGETENSYEAAEEGLTWVPPTDPPSVGSEPDGDPRIAAGFGSAGSGEPFDLDHHGDALPAEDEVSARVREALLANAATSAYADALAIETAGGLVRLSGVVADLEDETAVLEVVSSVPDIVEVDNRLSVEGLG